MTRETDSQRGTALLKPEPDTRPEAERHSSPLIGREDEIAAVERLLQGARHESLSGALVLRGPAGAGKTALLHEAERRAPDMRTLTSSGVESEAELPFAALHQLVRPILSRAEMLPAIQARALRCALGLEDGNGERFLVSVAVLSLLAEAAEDGPLLCLIDDAHWLDDSSAEALVFAARRLGAEGIVMLFATREGETRRFEAPAIPELLLTGLGPGAAAALLERESHTLLAPDVRQRLIDFTEGNPLALLELSASLTEPQRSGGEPMLSPLPVSWEVERAFLVRVRCLPEATQTLLLVAAADDSGELSTVLDAAGRLGIASDALDPAEGAGLVRVRRSRIELSHPLVRSAVYQGAPASMRRAAHAALADVLTTDGQADRRAWHRAAASVEPDPAVVADLEHAAHRARRRGAFASASFALERAAALTRDDEQRAGQLAAAGEDAWVAGNPDRALTLLERARPLTAGPLLRADIDRFRGLIGLNGGVPADACQLMLRAAEAVASFDAQRALQLLSIASLAATHACDGGAIVAIGEAARQIEADQTPTARLLSQHLRGLGDYYAGRFAEAAPRLRAALELAHEVDAEGTTKYAEILIIASSVGLFLGDDHAVAELHRRVVTRARETGAIGLLTWALPRLAVSDIWAGHLASAHAGFSEALELGRALGQPVIVAYVLSELAIVAALRGDEEACRSLAAESLELASERRLDYIAYIASSALVAMDVALGRYDDALTRSRSYRAIPGLDFWDALDRIEAAVRAGDAGSATTWLEPFACWSENSRAPWARAVATHCRALLASQPDEAERLFLEALELHAHANRPFELARTEFAFGEFLRRSRRRTEARRLLRASLDTFERLGAAAWAERARIELRASGQTARKRDPSTIDDLTPQELQIAQRVGEGGTNRDVAAQLFLSPRTVDFHLRNIFRKLGISTRTELARLDFDQSR